MVCYGSLELSAHYGYAGSQDYRVRLEVQHDIRGDASICIIPENQDPRCVRSNQSFMELVPVPGVEIGEEVKVCVTNLGTGVQDCETEVNDRGGIDGFQLTVPPDPEPTQSPTPDAATGSGGISTSSENAIETTSEPTTSPPSEPLSSQPVQGLLIPLLVIIAVIIPLIVIVRRLRRTKPADSVDFE